MHCVGLFVTDREGLDHYTILQFNYLTRLHVSRPSRPIELRVRRRNQARPITSSRYLASSVVTLFPVVGPRIWNKLLDVVTSAESLHV